MWFTQGVGSLAVVDGDSCFNVEGKSAGRERFRDLALLSRRQVLAFEHVLDRAGDSWHGVTGAGHRVRPVTVVERGGVLDGVVPMFVPIAGADPDRTGCILAHTREHDPADPSFFASLEPIYRAKIRLDRRQVTICEVRDRLSA